MKEKAVGCKEYGYKKDQLTLEEVRILVIRETLTWESASQSGTAWKKAF